MQLVYMKFGSHLYGTDTPQSDVDYKGVYMPTKREIYLSNFKSTISSSTGDNNSKNGADDVDEELFSLHQFIKLACEGQTVAIDMLHAPSNMISVSSDIWDEIVLNRDKFYTKNLQAFTGYCRRQAAKYGIKGSRLNSADLVINFLKGMDESIKMRDVWDSLPTGEHIEFMPPNPKDTNDCRIYQVCGRKYLETVKVHTVVSSLKTFKEAYGSRAALAAKNQGIDWKALSHALRAAYQLEEIYTTGKIVFPLKCADYLRDVKQGKLDYLSEVAPKLESLMDRTEELSESTNLPDKVDREFWDDFICRAVESRI